MTDITTSRNISAIVPVSHFGGITPLCVPMEPDSSFSEEVSGRFSKRVGSLWERLGLVFFTEEQQAPAATEEQLVVNNFSSQIIFQLFGNKNTRRLVVKDQPGFVYLDNICKQHESRQRLISERISREISERITSTDRIAQQVKSLYDVLGDDKAECSSQLLVITLEKLLREQSSRKNTTETEVLLLKQLQRSLHMSESVHETKLLERLSKVTDVHSITADDRAEILSAISDYSAEARASGLHRKAAELIVSAVAESVSKEEVRKKLTHTIDRLHKVIYDESSITVGNSRAVLPLLNSDTTTTQSTDKKQRTAAVSPAVQKYDITRSVTELLQGAADEVDTDRTLTAEQRIVSSFSGKSIEEIDKRIRRVYESIAVKDRAYKGQVISAAKDVVVSLIASGSAPVSIKQKPDSIVSQTFIAPVSQMVTSGRINNISVMPTTIESASALSTYFTDLSSGVEQFYAINANDAQGVSYRDIKKAVSHLMNSRTTQNVVSAPLNSILHTSNVTVASGRVNDITINNANNYSDTSYNAYSENIYRSRSAELSAGQDIHYEHIFIDEADIMQNVQNGDNTSNVTVNGTVLPAEQNNYTLNRSGDVYYAENRQGDVNISGTQVTNITNAQRTTQQGDDVRNVSNTSNVTVNGTVLPAEQNNYTLNRSGDVYYAENRQGDVNISGTQVTNITNAQRTTQQGDDVRNVSNTSNTSNVTVNGTVLPAEQNNYTLNRSGDVYYAENRLNNVEQSGAPTSAVSASYRNRLDSKTLAALDEMIQNAGIKPKVRNTAEEISQRYTVKENSSDIVYEYVQPDRQTAESSESVTGKAHRRILNGQQPDRMQMNQLRTAAVMRRGVGLTPANGSAHISSLIAHLSHDAELVQKGGTVNSSFSYRTIDSGENMVMLIPPTEMDRYQAESGYSKQMPPIELKQKPEPEQQAQKKKKTAINVKDEPVTVKTIGSIEGMSREEISKLVDKVYEQLEVRLLRERRRHGL